MMKTEMMNLNKCNCYTIPILKNIHAKTNINLVSNFHFRINFIIIMVEAYNK